MVEIGGKNIKNSTLAIGAVGLGAAFLLYRHFVSGSSSSTTANTSSGIDPTTGLPYSQDNQIDPATGMTYLAEAQQYGSVAAAEAAVQGNYSSYGYSAYAPQDVGYPTSNVGTTSTATGFSSNAQWAQQVEQDLTAIGYSATEVASAVGRYLAKLPLSSTQANIIQVALAEDGPPPQGSFSIIPQPSGSGGGGSGSGGAGGGSTTGASTVKVPNVIGQDWHSAQSAIRAAGLQVRSLKDAGGNSGTYRVVWQRPTGGTDASPGSIVDIQVKQ